MVVSLVEGCNGVIYNVARELSGCATWHTAASVVRALSDGSVAKGGHAVVGVPSRGAENRDVSARATSLKGMLFPHVVFLPAGGSRGEALLAAVPHRARCSQHFGCRADLSKKVGSAVLKREGAKKNKDAVRKAEGSGKDADPPKEVGDTPTPSAAPVTTSASSQQEFLQEATKVLKLAKLTGDGEGKCLVDGGATTSMRRASSDDEVRGLPRRTVKLAVGETDFYVNEAGTLLTLDSVAPILAMVDLMEIGCRVTWTSSAGCKVWHPRIGWLPVRMVDGCPEVVALDWSLSRRLRASREAGRKRRSMFLNFELMWATWTFGSKERRWWTPSPTARMKPTSGWPGCFHKLLHGCWRLSQ